MNTLPFETTEFEKRIADTRKSMLQAGIDVLVVTDPANMYYLTGYDAWSFYVHQVVIIEHNGQPTWIGRESDANGVPLTTYLDSDHAIGYPETCIESIDNHAFKFIGNFLGQKGYGSRHVGVEMEAYYFTARALAMLQIALPNANTVDATGLVNKVRLVKSENELNYMREAGIIVEKTMQTAIDNISAGRRQNEVVAEIYHTQISGTEDFGGDYTAIVPLLPSGVYSGAPHITWSDRPFVENEGTIIEIGGCRLRYHCPLARTLFLGKPPQKMLDTEAAVVEGVAMALESAKTGALAEDVEAVWRKSISKWGVVKASRLGYSIGINYPPDWGEHSTSLRPGDKTVLQQDMTFHLMPGVWYEGWGMEISQPFRVTDNGGESLTNFPRKLIIKD